MGEKKLLGFKSIKTVLGKVKVLPQFLIGGFFRVDVIDCLTESSLM